MQRSESVISAILFVLLSVVGAPSLAQTGPDVVGGNADRGAEIWEMRCTGCHSLDADRVGPRHRGVFGRVAGTVPGFAYSQGLKESGLRWTASNLDRWLTDPRSVTAGTRMGFRLQDPAQRLDIIAFLQRESGP
jgi:cytochrome c